MIKFEKVYVQYISEFYTLYDFSCEINSHTLFVGDFFSGTNAIVRVLSKIDKDYIGNILIDNKDLKTIKDKDLNLAYLPENPIMLKNKNIFKNLFFPLKIRKINKKLAKNLILSMFFELKNNNFNIFYNYLNLNKMKKNSESNILINKILNLKIKKLNKSELKIIALIRAVLRKPRYVIMENLFEDLDKDYIEITNFLISRLKESSTIIACENNNNSNFKDFKIINLINEKKED